MLEIHSLTKQFGSLVAVDAVSFEIEAGEFRSLIGPNGAGKTTLFNMITGALSPTDGEVFFRGENITGAAPHEIVRNGISRSFQITSVYPALSVRENLRVTAQANSSERAALLRSKEDLDPPLERANDVMGLLGLAAVADEEAQNLSHGQQRKLEIGLTLASDPDLLMLDEPTAGMSQQETTEMIDILEQLKSEYTIFLVEHDMDVVMSLSDTIAVLHYGEIIEDGSPEEIQNSETVREAYLGSEEIHA